MSSVVAALTPRDFLRTDGLAAKDRSDDDSKESARGRATQRPTAFDMDGGADGGVRTGRIGSDTHFKRVP